VRDWRVHPHCFCTLVELRAVSRRGPLCSGRLCNHGGNGSGSRAWGGSASSWCRPRRERQHSCHNLGRSRCWRRRRSSTPPSVFVATHMASNACDRNLAGCSTTGARRRRWRGRRSTRGAADAGGVGGADEVGLGRNGDGGPAYERRCEPAKGRAWPRRPPRGPSGRGRRARQATTDRAPRSGCSALRAERSLLLVCNDRFGRLCMHGGNYLHWLVTARVNSLLGNWARATVSALLGRRATTVGGTVVAGK